MTPAVFVSLAALTLGALGQTVWLVVWGAKLTQRVLTLEKEIGPLKDLATQVARIAERQDMWIEQLKDLNAAIRWMREPAGYSGPGAITRPRRDTTV